MKKWTKEELKGVNIKIDNSIENEQLVKYLHFIGIKDDPSGWNRNHLYNQSNNFLQISTNADYYFYLNSDGASRIQIKASEVIPTPVNNSSTISGLPKKWKVKVSNWLDIEGYLLSKYGKICDYEKNNINFYLYSDEDTHFSIPKYVSISSHNDYTEITFEQFKTHVLGQITTEKPMKEEIKLEKGKYYSCIFQNAIYWFGFQSLSSNSLKIKGLRHENMSWMEDFTAEWAYDQHSDFKEVSYNEAKGIKEAPISSNTSENLVDRWVKCLKSGEWNSDLKAGDFLKIISQDGSYLYFDYKDKFPFDKNRFSQGTFELQPIGFQPPKEETKQEYVVGFWYKHVIGSNNFAKFERVAGNKWYFSENILAGVYQTKQEALKKYGNNTWDTDKMEINVAKLSDYNQYLPKSTNTMTNSSIPNCYICLDNEDQYNQITKWLDIKGYRLWNGYNWKNKPSNHLYIDKETKSGKEYFMCCKSLSNVLTINDLQQYGFVYNQKTDNSSDIPEYVQFISSTYGNQFTKDKIYKVANSTDTWIAVEKDDNGTRNGWERSKFKNSTKEAYQQQEQLAQYKESADPYEVKLPITGNIFKSDCIEIGDEIETDCCNSGGLRGKMTKGTVIEIDNSSDFEFCYKISYAGSYTTWVYPYIGYKYVKLIKKRASNTHSINQKQGNFSPKVEIGNTAIDIIAPKTSNSVTLGTIQKEVKININFKKSIKL